MCRASPDTSVFDRGRDDPALWNALLARSFSIIFRRFMMSASSRLCSSASEDAGSEPIICAISFDRLCWSLLVAFTEPFGKGAKQLSQAAGVNVRPIFCFLQPDSAKSCNRVSVAERVGVTHATGREFAGTKNTIRHISQGAS